MFTAFQTSMFNFNNKSIIITGGNGGIGRAIGLAFAQVGGQVVLLGRNKGKGAESVAFLEKNGHSGRFFSVDLADSAAVERFYADFQLKYGQMDVLINCAGAGESRGGSVKVFEKEQNRDEVDQRWVDMVGSNLQSAYLMSSLGAPLMSDGGSMINISSTASIHGNYGLYGTFKAGMEGLTRSLAVELAPRQIRVNAISPGWIETANTLPDPNDTAQAAWAAQTSLLGRMGRPEEIANVCLFLASSLSTYITGETIRVDGGLTIIDPTTESWRASRKS